MSIKSRLDKTRRITGTLNSPHGVRSRRIFELRIGSQLRFSKMIARPMAQPTSNDAHVHHHSSNLNTLLRESIIPGLCKRTTVAVGWALCAVISLAEGSVCVASGSAFTIATGKHIGDRATPCLRSQLRARQRWKLAMQGARQA